jgi:hypothetical protein
MKTKTLPLHAVNSLRAWMDRCPRCPALDFENVPLEVAYLSRAELVQAFREVKRQRLIAKFRVMCDGIGFIRIEHDSQGAAQ